LEDESDQLKVSLRAMDEPAFRASFDQSVRRHADEQVQRGVWTSSRALQASREEMAQLLSRGRATPGYRFCQVLERATGAVVGETWYSVRARGGTTHFWIDWIWIDLPFRRQGFGEDLLRWLEIEAVRSGADRVGLHVFSGNTAARALYGKRGFETTNLRMAKRVGPSARGSP